MQKWATQGDRRKVEYANRDSEKTRVKDKLEKGPRNKEKEEEV